MELMALIQSARLSGKADMDGYHAELNGDKKYAKKRYKDVDKHCKEVGELADKIQRKLNRLERLLNGPKNKSSNRTRPRKKKTSKH
jgi:hypothetical protein